MGDIQIPTTFTAAWIIVLAAVALLIQAIVNQPQWSANTKRLITVIVAVLLGAVYMVATGAITSVPVNVQDALVYWFVVVAGIIAVGQAVYAYLKPYLEKIEKATAGEPQDGP